jgi:replicative DNA helicase
MRDQTSTELGLYDDASEQIVIAALLKSESDADYIVPMVSVDCFDDVERSLIFEAAASLRSRGQVVTSDSVVAQSRAVAHKRGLKKVNVITSGMVERAMNVMTDGKDIRAHAAELERLKALRAYSTPLNEMIAMLADRKPVGEVAQRLAGMVSTMSMHRRDSSNVVMGYDAPGYIDEMLTRAKSGKIRRYEFPWDGSRRVVMPLVTSHMLLIAGINSSGKTALSETLAESWARDYGMHVAYAHTEYGLDYIQARRLTRLTGIPTYDILSNRLSLEQDKLIDAAKAEIRSSYGTLHYLAVTGKTAPEIVGEFWSIKNANQLDAVFLDYGQDVPGINPRWDRNERSTQTVLTYHHALADLNVVGVMVAQCKKTGLDDTRDLITRDDIDLPQQAIAKSQMTWLIWRNRLKYDGEDTRISANGTIVPWGRKGGRSSTMHVQVDNQTMGPTGGFDLYMYDNYLIGDVPEPLRKPSVD